VATALLPARPVHGSPGILGCGRSITAGDTIMGSPVEIGSASIKLQKGGTPIACGSSLTAGDTGLTFAVSGQGSQYVVQAIASAGTGSWGIQGGQCSMQRVDNTASNTYTVPASGTVTVRVAGASSYGPVRVSQDCKYTVTTASSNWRVEFGGCYFSGNTDGAPLVRLGPCPTRGGILDLSGKGITSVPPQAFEGMYQMQ
jgi:hypothetical protein